MVPGDDEETDYTTTENPEDIKVIRHRGGFAVVSETEVSTASPDWIYNPHTYPPIDFDNRHERRKKAAIARKKRKGKSEDHRIYGKGRKR